MRYENILNELCFRPWAIELGAWNSIFALMQSRLARASVEAAEPPAGESDGFFTSRSPLHIDDEGNAHIHILGPLAKGISALEKTCGATGYEDIHADIDEAEAKGAEGFVFTFDTPGGAEIGLHETARRISDIKAFTVAYSETRMLSAGYWLAAATNGIVASPSARIGSIGVVCPYVDSTKQLAAMGIEERPITNAEGDLKAIGFGPLTPEQEKYLKAEAQEMFEVFKGFVTARRKVPDEAMRGQSFRAASVVLTDMKAELVDRVGGYGAALSLLEELKAEGAQLGRLLEGMR